MKTSETKGINKNFYPAHTLNNVNFDLEVGEVSALVGENGVGKSTLMNILLGIHKSTSGSMQLDRKPYMPKNPHDALQQGISMTHQELRLAPSMTIADNVWIRRVKEFSTGRLYFPGRCVGTMEKLLEEYGIALNPREIIKDLGVAQMQMMEIARTILYHSRVVIIDKPTGALSDKEVSVLYKIIRHLAEKGTAIVFISHRLEEVFKVADRVTIFRDGQKISTRKVSEITMDDLVDGTAGRKAESLYPKPDIPAGDVVLDVKNISRTSVFENVSFQARASKILGSAGLVDSGRAEIMSGIYGVGPVNSREICLEGKRIQSKTSRQALNNSVAMVTKDCLRRGMVTKMNVKMNMTLAYFYKVCKASFINTREENEGAKNMVQGLHVKAAGIHIPIWSLSGGNQQKVMVGRALFTGLKVLILDKPTHGMDMGARSEIYDYCNQLAKQGMMIILVSSDLPEVVGMNDRMLVAREGRIVDRHNWGTVTAEQIMGETFGLIGHEDMEDEK